jgi:hypothetical protein
LKLLRDGRPTAAHDRSGQAYARLSPFFHLAQLAPRPRSAESNFSPRNLSMNFCASARSLKQ